MEELMQAQNEFPENENENMAQQGLEIDSELTPEQAKASLGLSTRLSEQFLTAQAQQEAMMQGETDEVSPEEASPDAPESPENTPDSGVEEEAIEKEEPENEGKTEEIENMKTDIELLKKLVLKEDSE